MTADSTASSSATSSAAGGGGGAAVVANNNNNDDDEGGRRRRRKGKGVKKKKVDPVTAVQDGVDGLALSLFEALRGARDAAVPPSAAVAVVDDPFSSASALPHPPPPSSSSSSAFLRETTEEDHHHHHRRKTTSAAMGGEDGEEEGDAAVVASAKTRLLSGLNVGYFSSRAYDPLDPDYESFLLAYLGDDAHAGEMVRMMTTTMGGGGTTTTTTVAGGGDGGTGGGAAVVEKLTDDDDGELATVVAARIRSGPAGPGGGGGVGGVVGVVVGDVGYEFRKEFSSGWYVGRVIEIRPLAGEYCGAVRCGAVHKNTHVLSRFILSFRSVCVCAEEITISSRLLVVYTPPFDIVSFIVSPLKRTDTTGGACTPTETSRI